MITARLTSSRPWQRALSATRLLAVGAVALAALGSAGSKKTAQQPQAAYGAPEPRAMDPGQALGLWQSSFGAVKIEQDPAQGRPEAVQGAWTYQRGGAEVVGLFWGDLRGNVLQFSWQEPADPAPLEGGGYLVFDPSGTRFNGKWWTTSGDRSGDWNGWRDLPPNAATAPAGGYPAGGAAYGGSGYGGVMYGTQVGGATYGETAPEAPPPPPGF